jgi:hypothetical protein
MAVDVFEQFSGPGKRSRFGRVIFRSGHSFRPILSGQAWRCVDIRDPIHHFLLRKFLEKRQLASIADGTAPKRYEPFFGREKAGL